MIEEYVWAEILQFPLLVAHEEESVKETPNGPEMAAMPGATTRKSGVLC